MGVGRLLTNLKKYMNMESKNTCQDGTCGGGSCGCSCCSHKHHGLKMLAKVIGLIFIVCFSLKMGEIKGMLESSHMMYRSQGQFQGGMMHASGWNTMQPASDGTNAVAPAATPSK